MRREFVTVDVFTDRRFGGNPLAVVPDATGLTAEQMQSIAAEFNLSETTFVLPPRLPANTAQVRIFTPKAELPFAGHPNVGTAFVLAGRGSVHGRPAGDPMVFEEKAGLVRLELIRENGIVVGAGLTAPQPLLRGNNIDLDIVAAACSIDADDIDTAHHRPCKQIGGGDGGAGDHVGTHQGGRRAAGMNPPDDHLSKLPHGPDGRGVGLAGDTTGDQSQDER